MPDKNDWTREELEEQVSSMTAVTIPVHMRIEGAQRIFDLSEMKTILKNAKLISIGECYCRKNRKKCNGPLDVCFSLDKAAKIRIVGEDTDLTFNAKGRKWINGDGLKNMPDGEVFTTPLENSVNGKIRFTFPGIHIGREVEDISLAFKNGKIAKASAAKGEDLLKEIVKIKGADRIGEAAIGTNYGINRFTKNMLLDEKMGGTIHMALGMAYRETGGKNHSAIHWDILKDMKKNAEIYADNELFYKNGKFLE